MERILQDLDRGTSQEPPTRAFVQAPLRHHICKLLERILPGSSQDLLLRTCTGSCENLLNPLERNLPGFPQDLLIRTYARSCTDLLEDVSRIVARSSDKVLYKIIEGHPAGFRQDLRSIFSQGPLYQTWVKIFLYAPWNPCKSVIEGHSSESMRFRFQDPRDSAKIMTAPQRERSDTHKVLRGLCEPCQNSHRATTRAIWHAQVREGCASTC